MASSVAFPSDSASISPSPELSERESEVVSEHGSAEQFSDAKTSPKSTSKPKGKIRTTSPSAHSKPCSLCQKPRDVLVRCQASAVGPWLFVCAGKCWKEVSGGVIDGDKAEGREGYRYGGMWKNKRAGVSAKKKTQKPSKRKGGANESQLDVGGRDDKGVQDGNAIIEWTGNEEGKQYTRNDRVRFEGKVWLCRRTHVFAPGGRHDGGRKAREMRPGTGYRFWKEVG